jgi:GNAT superfamily N-acetyltransferase
MSGFADYDPGTTRRAAEVLVRPAEVGDLTACAALIVTRTGETVEKRRAKLVGDLDHPDRYTVVACVDDQPVGYASVFRHDLSAEHPVGTAPSGYYLVGLIVAPEWRRHGIGELLTLDRIAWVAERADTVWYFANAANGPTLDLHERLGFVEVTRDFSFPNAPLQPGTGVLLKAPVGSASVGSASVG